MQEQSHQGFEVHFVDYGSGEDQAKIVEQLVLQYKFAKYRFHPTQDQPWNKSKALNSVIKHLNTKYCFIADVDIIFHPAFVERIIQVQSKSNAVYFQVAYLSSRDSEVKNPFISLPNYRRSTSQATGLSLIPVKALRELRGFDEFYHFWGAEDTDMHVRLKNAGYKVQFYDKEILLLHQWHPSYQSKETSHLTRDLQLSEVVQLNDQHLKSAIKNKTTVVNPHSWGECLTNEELNDLENPSMTYFLTNEKRQIDEFLYGQLPEIKKGIIRAIISGDPLHGSLKYLTKKALRKKVPRFYSLKEINDLLLMHLISYHRNNAYYYKVDSKLDKIEMAVKIT